MEGRPALRSTRGWFNFCSMFVCRNAPVACPKNLYLSPSLPSPSTASSAQPAAIYHMLSSSGWTGKSCDAALVGESIASRSICCEDPTSTVHVDLPNVAPPHAWADEVRSSNSHEGESIEQDAWHESYTRSDSQRKPAMMNRDVLSAALNDAYDKRERSREQMAHNVSTAVSPEPARTDSRPTLSADTSNNGTDSGGRQDRSRMFKLKHPNVLLQEEKRARLESQV